MTKLNCSRSKSVLAAITGVLFLAIPLLASAQTVNIDRVVAEFEPEIQRTLLAGNIPSASIALVSGNQVIWTGAYGYSNLLARTPAAPNTVYLIGSPLKRMSTVGSPHLIGPR